MTEPWIVDGKETGPAKQHRFFKACTRPPMFFGVPLVPLVVATGLFVIGGIWLAYLVSAYFLLAVVVVYIPALMFMRDATKADDQRLRQLFLRLRMRARAANRRLWGAVSYSPLRYKRR